MFQKQIPVFLLIACLVANAASAESKSIGESSFSAALEPGKYILPAKPGWWNWCMAPIYDESGKLHIFVSSIPNDGAWQKDGIIQHFKIGRAHV